MMYESFALIYDRVMKNVDYPTWADYILNLGLKYGFDYSSVCDLACGTGSFALILSGRGSRVVGVDQSAEMLQQAQEKARSAGVRNIEWIRGDLVDFNLGRKFPFITCLYDSLNYLLTEEDVSACFRQVHKHLTQGGGFIFDITTEYNILTNFADYTFAENLENCSYIWENRYDYIHKIICSEVTLFQKNGKHYIRHEETHSQKIYSTAQIDTLLVRQGFEVLGAFEGFTLNAPGPKVERIHFVCRKR